MTTDFRQHLVAQLRDAVVAPWESLHQVVSEHGGTAWGDASAAGSPAWHAMHIVSVFRLHASTATAGELSFEAAEAADPTATLATLRGDVERFSRWAVEQPAERWAARFEYGHAMDLPEMIGVMSRHIVFHAAAIHYGLRRRT